jgi:flagellar basal body-associated protein FliL
LSIFIPLIVIVVVVVVVIVVVVVVVIVVDFYLTPSRQGAKAAKITKKVYNPSLRGGLFPTKQSNIVLSEGRKA